MPKLLNIFGVMPKVFLLVIICIPGQVVANPASPLPCIRFLKSIAQKQDKPYLELYALSTVQPEKAIKHLPKVTKMLLPDYSPFRKAIYLLIQYNIEQAEGDDDVKVQGYISKLHKLGEETQIKWIQAEASFLQAVEWVDKRKYDEAAALLDEVEADARELGYVSLLARTIKWQANIDIDHSEYKKALTRYQQAYDLFIDCGDTLQVAQVLSNMSTLYIRMEEWPKADLYIQQAIEIYRKHNFSNPFAEAILYINVSVIDKYLNRPQERIKHIKKAMVLASKTRSFRVKLTALMNLSAVYLDANRPQKALENAMACLKLAEKVGEPRGVAYCNESLGEAYFKLGELEAALKHTSFARDNYQKLGDRKRYIYISNLIADIFEEAGDYKEALKYYKTYANDDKEYLFDVRRKELFDLQERFDAKVKEQEITLLKTENELNSARIAEQKARENSLRVGVLFILFVLYLLYRRYKDVRRDNEVLEQSNAELTTQSIQDPLTKLHNRRYLQQWLKSAPKHFKQPTSLLALLDIDHFKAINDKLGHDVGDQVLIILAQRLKETICCDDLVVRWGGEEFLLIINTCKTEAESVLEHLRLLVSDSKFTTNGGEITVTVSIGAAVSETPEALQENWESMLQAADKALYNVKSAGRNGYQLSTSSS